LKFPPQNRLVVTSHSGHVILQVGLLSSAGWEPSTGQSAVIDIVWLGNKGRSGSFHFWSNVWVAGQLPD